MKSRWLKNALSLAIILVILAGFVYALMPQPVQVDSAVIDRGDIVVTVNDEGMTRIRDVYLVVAPVSGNVLRFPLDIGDPVTSDNTIVAIIQPSRPEFLNARERQELQATLAAADAAVDVARANLDSASLAAGLSRSELRRLSSLGRNTLISRRELEVAEMDLAIKRAALTSATAELEFRHRQRDGAAARLIGPDSYELCSADAEKNCIRIYSPADGVLLKIFNKSEHVVRTGENLVEVGDPEQIEIVVELLSSDAVQVKQGARVFIERWGGEGALTGRVSSVEPIAFTKVSALGVDEQRVNTIIELDSDSAVHRGLGHNYRVQVKVVVWRGEDLLRVPLGALFRSGRKWAVYRVMDGTAQVSEIEIGHRNEQFAEVVTGLDLGDQVILYPSDRISNGSRVEKRSAQQ